jgi:hypothetical protein
VSSSIYHLPDEGIGFCDLLLIFSIFVECRMQVPILMAVLKISVDSWRNLAELTNCSILSFKTLIIYQILTFTKVHMVAFRPIIEVPLYVTIVVYVFKGEWFNHHLSFSFGFSISWLVSQSRAISRWCSVEPFSFLYCPGTSSTIFLCSSTKVFHIISLFCKNWKS